MKTGGRLVSLLAVALLLVPVWNAQAQTTGRIFGQVLDAQGAAVPGATVTTSPALQGSLTQATDVEGRFRFPSLPPGRYAAKVELGGFKTLEQTNIEVGLDRTVNLPLTLEVAAVAEVVTVTGASPVIDQTSTVTGLNVDSEVFNRLPIRRDFYAMTRLAAGVTEDNVGPVVYGSTGAENQYIIDGLNTTGVELGSKGKTFNFDFIQEVEVKTGGLPAEYGRTTGGIVNAITKSGSNAFRGAVFGFTEGGAFQADESTRDQRPEWTTQVVDVSHRADAGGELGGYLLRDRLWFFGAVNYPDEGRDTTVIRELTAPGSPAVDSVIPATIRSTLFATKVTGRIAQGQTVNASVLGDPTSREGNIFTISGPESTWQGERKTGGTDVQVKYDGVFGGRFLLSGQVARHKETEENLGQGRNIPQNIDLTVVPNALTGGFGFFQDQEFTRQRPTRRAF